MSGGADGITDMDADYGNMDDEQIDSTDMESGADSYTEPDMEEDSETADDSSDDRSIRMKNLYQSMKHLV